MVTATLHKITAGDGYEYYTRQVAAHDASDRGRSPLADYYSARGETPGTWLGSGLAGLTITYRDRKPDPAPSDPSLVDDEVKTDPAPLVDEDDAFPVREVAASRVNVGDVVTEEQMLALFGLGIHPQADAITGEIVALELACGATRKMAERAAEKASRLGRRFQVFNDDNAFRRQCARAFSEYNTDLGLAADDPVPDEVRARIRTAVARGMFRYELARDPLNERELSGWIARNSRQNTTAVAGYGWCFTPPKSVAVLWALAPPRESELIAQAHRLAALDGFGYLESQATYTRKGKNGVRQVDVDGLIAASFEHRDSRSGDPDLHTHIVVANRVRALEDGQWGTLDGTMFYRAKVTASEIYNTRLEHHLETLLGLRFAPRPGTNPSKRPIREIIGVDVALIKHFSQRNAAVISRLGQLTVEFQQQLGRDPTSREMYGLSQRATLETRPHKHAPRSLSEQREMWRRQAESVLGSSDAVTAMLTRALTPRSVTRPQISVRWIVECAEQVIDTVSGERSTWRRTHVRSEAERLTRGRVHPDLWPQVVEAVVDQALAPTQSVPRGDPNRAAEPALRNPPEVFRRADRTSAFTAVGGPIYSSVEILSTEAQLISMITESRGRVVPGPVVEAAIAAYNDHPAHRDRQLNQGQEAVVRGFATSGLGIQITDAPAGTGKTTAMTVLTSAWLASGGTVCGLAPTAKAAGELSAEIAAPVNTVDKFLHVLDSHTPTLESIVFDSDRPPPSLPQWILDIDETTLVIIDEHVQIPDLARLRVLIFMLGRGATVRLLGDQWQLQSIDAGGSARDMIAVAGADVLTLTDVVRFADNAEAAASLAIREGNSAGLGFYLDRDRVRIGSPASVVNGAFHAWLADHLARRDTIMLASTHAVVDELNALAREYRLSGMPDPGLEVALGDGRSASAGDTIRTTLNNRQLTVGNDDFVRNGYQWTVTSVRPDGSIVAVRQLPHRRHGEAVYLPADYVAANTRLGYAATIGSVQGVTVDTSHTVLTGNESRYQLYVATTRGRSANHLYVTTSLNGTPEESFWTERAVLPPTATDILVAILGRDATATSAHTELRRTIDPLLRIGRAADVYAEALAVASEHALGTDAMARLDADAETLLPTLTSGPAWPVLRQHLATLALSGHNPVHALRDAIASRELTTADNIAAVLDWRLDTSGQHSAPPGPLPWLPGIPHALTHHSEFGEYLSALARIVTDLERQLRHSARDFTSSNAPTWARPLLDADPELLADLVVWRAATRVATQDLRPAGPPRHTVIERRHHHRLVLRANEAIGEANLAATHWAATVKQLDDRITDDPFWPVLATHLDNAHRAGIDIDALLTQAAAPRPLPDDMPAAALWSRLDLDPETLSTSTESDNGLPPDPNPGDIVELSTTTPPASSRPDHTGSGFEATAISIPAPHVMNVAPRPAELTEDTGTADRRDHVDATAPEDAAEPAASLETDTEPASALSRLTDAELAQRISELTRHIAGIIQLDAAVFAPPPPETPQRQRHHDVAAIDAIALARTAATELSAVQARVDDLTRSISTTAQRRITATRRERRGLDTQLTTLRTDKQALLTELDHARHDERAARRHAELLAGPAHEWDATLSTLRSRLEQDAPKPRPNLVVAGDTYLVAEKEQLAALRAERDRRGHLDIPPATDSAISNLTTSTTPERDPLPEPAPDYGIDPLF